MPQQQTVGELLVDDTDVTGDDHGPPAPAVPGPAQAVQHRLDAPADEGEQDDVVRLLLHGTQELEAGHLAQGVGADADLLELAGRGGGSAAQEEAVQADVRVLRARRVAVSAPHFHRVSESASTATRRLFVALAGTPKTLGSNFVERPNPNTTKG